MHRFLVNPNQIRDRCARFSLEESRHALQVLRVRVGDRVGLIDGRGSHYQARISSIERSGVEAAIDQVTKISRPLCALHLFHAVTKAASMDFVFRKSTELGVSRLTPVVTRHSVAAWKAKEISAKRNKWEQSILSAMKQSGCPWQPELDPPRSFEEAVALSRDSDLALAGILGEERFTPQDRIADFQKNHGGRKPDRTALWIGPEGDFSESERADLAGAGVLSVWLGPWVLRSETAVIAGLAALQTALHSRPRSANDPA